MHPDLETPLVESWKDAWEGTKDWTEKHKTGLKVAGGVVATGLIGYGAYKASKPFVSGFRQGNAEGKAKEMAKEWSAWHQDLTHENQVQGPETPGWANGFKHFEATSGTNHPDREIYGGVNGEAIIRLSKHGFDVRVPHVEKDGAGRTGFMVYKAPFNEKDVDTHLNRIESYTNAIGRTIHPDNKYAMANMIHHAVNGAPIKTVKNQFDQEIFQEALKDTTELQDHQKRLAAKLAKEHGVLAYWGLGSGKSLGSIASTQGHHPDVVVPASLRSNYEKEIAKHTQAGTYHANIMSYEKAVKDREPTSKTLIMDEPQAIGHSDTQRSQLLVKKAQQYDHRLLMTGTPIRNHPSELSPLINAVTGEHSLPVDKDTFEAKYTKAVMSNPSLYRRVWKGDIPVEVGRNIKNADKLADILRGHVDYHMPSQENFPSHSEETIQVQMSKEQQKLYDYAEKQLNPITAYRVKMGLPVQKRDTADLNKFLSSTRQIGNTGSQFGGKEVVSPKIERAVDELEKRQTADPNFRGLVYSNYLGSGVHEYSKELGRRGIEHHIFDGSLNDKQKQKVVDDYNNGRVKNLLISGAGAQGLDLKGTKLVQILEPHWNSARVDQAKGRAIRYKSHDHLPEDERHVEVQNFQSTIRPGLMDKIKAPYTAAKNLRDKLLGYEPVKPLSADEYLKGMNDSKDKLNNQFLDVLKKVGQEPVRESSGERGERGERCRDGREAIRAFESAYDERVEKLGYHRDEAEKNIKVRKWKAAINSVPYGMVAGALMGRSYGNSAGLATGFVHSLSKGSANPVAQKTQQLLNSKVMTSAMKYPKTVSAGIGALVGGVMIPLANYQAGDSPKDRKNIQEIGKQGDKLKDIHEHLLKRLGREPSHEEIDEEWNRLDQEKIDAAARRAAQRAQAGLTKSRGFQTD